MRKLPFAAAVFSLFACSPEDLAALHQRVEANVNELSHKVSVRFEDGAARLTVKRQLRNDTTEFQSLNRHLELPEGAVATSLRVAYPRKEGRDNPGGLPAILYGEIEKNIVKDVLEAAKFPQVRFRSTSVTASEVVGQLTLHGVTREIRCSRAPDGLVEARLDQRDFGIKPYSAMFGTLKVKPEVVVSVRLRG